MASLRYAFFNSSAEAPGDTPRMSVSEHHRLMVAAKSFSGEWPAGAGSREDETRKTRLSKTKRSARQKESKGSAEGEKKKKSQ
jgi:hypothetical protein